MKDMSKEIVDKIKRDLEVTRKASGKNLKEIIAASRKFSRKFDEKVEKLKVESELEILPRIGGKIYIRFNPQSYEDIREGYAMSIPDKVYTKVVYDTYTIDDDGNIECISNNIDTSHKPEAKPQDLEKINKHKEKLTKLAKEYKEISKQTRINLPDTDLSVLITGEQISLVHNLKPDSEGTFFIDDGVDFWVLANGKCDSISVPKGQGFVENMSEFLEEIHVQEHQLPEHIVQNIGEKISVFPKKDKSNPYGENYKITDYSKAKEKLANIVGGVKNRNKEKEEGELKNEQEFRDDK